MCLYDDFDFCFSDDVENFIVFMYGEVFGYDGDKFLMVKNEGEVIVFLNCKVVIG